MPPAERILWKYLRNKQIAGFKFRRQYSIGKYVVDFYCPKAKLAIEVDDPTHLSQRAKAYDQQRQKKIEAFGIKFLRVSNLDVYSNLEGVYQKIINCLFES
ncbi:MAG: endonuclease domain-containing protein [Patescibacteria group bacterium]